MRTSDRAVTWEDFDGAPLTSLLVKFKMPEIEQYTEIGCPRIYFPIKNKTKISGDSKPFLKKKKKSYFALNK